jgi:hypothetical protein
VEVATEEILLLQDKVALPIQVAVVVAPVITPIIVALVVPVL